MNYTKAQKIVFESICAGRRTHRFMLDDNNLFVTPDGYRGFIFPVASVCFNTEKIAEMGELPIHETIKAENELKLTDDCRFEKRDGGWLRRLKGNGKSAVFVNTKFLECFQNPRFYQDANKLSMIVVTEAMSRTLESVPVGIVLPVRVSDVGEDYYND